MKKKVTGLFLAAAMTMGIAVAANAGEAVFLLLCCN